MNAQVNGQDSHCWLSVPLLKQSWSLSLRLSTTPSPCNLVNCLPLPKSQAFRDPFCNGSSVFYLSWQPANPTRDPSHNLYWSAWSIAKPICRPSLEFSVSFNDKESHHLELTQLQSTQVNQGYHPTHLKGPQISPVSVALNNSATKAVGTCLLLCKSEPLDP